MVTKVFSVKGKDKLLALTHSNLVSVGGKNLQILLAPLILGVILVPHEESKIIF